MRGDAFKITPSGANNCQQTDQRARALKQKQSLLDSVTQETAKLRR